LEKYADFTKLNVSLEHEIKHGIRAKIVFSFRFHSNN